MGLFKNYVSQTRKPEGFLGKMMLGGMNCAFFSLKDETVLRTWSDRFVSVTAKSYMRGYRDIYSKVGLFHKLMIRFCDGLVRMKIVKIAFGG